MSEIGIDGILRSAWKTFRQSAPPILTGRRAMQMPSRRIAARIVRTLAGSHREALSATAGTRTNRTMDCGPRRFGRGSLRRAVDPEGRAQGSSHFTVERNRRHLPRHQDGTYRYRGQAFKAIVEKDGSVVFDDGYRQGTTLSFDMTDVIMRRRGEDPYRVENNWFLEGTAEFREELFERWRAKQTLLALRKLRRRLLHISENATLSDQQKSASVIAMFQDTSDDEAGAAARGAIAEFVDDKMPTIDLPREAR